MTTRRRFLQAAGLALLGLALTPSTLLAAAERVHLVRRGETLSAIARRYGVSVAALGRVGIKSGAGFSPAFCSDAGGTPAPRVAQASCLPSDVAQASRLPSCLLREARCLFSGSAALRAAGWIAGGTPALRQTGGRMPPLPLAEMPLTSV
ncbi:LysM peptidoglycan-binding domain-containing protein [Geminisphaera colitermitum]|uniref:LysM peptidoglycan-binding domain-containing protein n=1 Tax=Geminisphaera colitermitum TaxID=1148786 RepID=UPI000DDBC604|nr:LysM domain-containing protein [Geminisphaera colitermitum]